MKCAVCRCPSALRNIGEFQGFDVVNMSLIAENREENKLLAELKTALQQGKVVSTFPEQSTIASLNFYHRGMFARKIRFSHGQDERFRAGLASMLVHEKLRIKISSKEGCIRLRIISEAVQRFAVSVAA